MTKRILSIIIALAMMMGVMPAISLTAFGAETVTYLDENGETQTASATKVTSSDTAWAEGWYYVEGAVTLEERVYIDTDVKLILKDGATLTCKKGIGVVSDCFTIYSQSIGDNMGSIVATCESPNAAIGSDGDNDDAWPIIYINGGNITATGARGAGIGGGRYEQGYIKINNGVINATAYSAAAIGGGQYSHTGRLTINGGVINASSTIGYGIGRGNWNGDSTKAGNDFIKINGGFITASGIAGLESWCTMSINGGTIVVTGEDPLCSKEVTISGGNLKCDAKVDYDVIYGSLDDGDGLHEATIDGLTEEGFVTGLYPAKYKSYGLTDVKTVDTNMLYLWCEPSSIKIGDVWYDCDGWTEKTYNSYSATFYLHTEHDYDEQGICKICNGNEECEIVENYYRIGNAGQLKSFAAAVNAGNTTANAILVKDIDMTGLSWEPIKNYAGTFDGNDKTITGFTLDTGDSAANADGIVYNQGMFANLEGGLVKNFSIYGTISITTETNSVGVIGLIGQNGKAEGVKSYLDFNIANDLESASYIGGITGRLYYGSVYASSYHGTMSLGSAKVDQAGGIVGYVNYRNSNSVSDCCFNGNITTSNTEGGISIGGIIGYSNNGSFSMTNCVYGGTITAGDDTPADNITAFGTINSKPAKIANLYYVEGAMSNLVANSGNNTYTPDDGVLIAVSEDAMKSGEITWTLNGCSSDGVWKQTLGTDDYPMLAGETVYKNTVTCTEGAYCYDNDSLTKDHCDKNNDWKCDFCEEMIEITYIDKEWDDENKVMITTEKTTKNYTNINSTSIITGWTNGWYYVSESVEIDGRAYASGEAHLILADNVELTVQGGISVNEGNTFVLHTQSEGENIGRLRANTNTSQGYYNAAIGGYKDKNAGTIIINGGYVRTSSPYYATCIGAGQAKKEGTVIINGGDIYLTSTTTPTIGASDITINGGKVVATVRDSAAAISCRSGQKVTINGGFVSATGGTRAPGIGGVYNKGAGAGEITITGGTVVATGGLYTADNGTLYGGAGIGGAAGGGGGTITITGGNIYAVPGGDAQAIGAGSNGNEGVLTNADGEDVYLNTITLDSVTEETYVTDIRGVESYGLNDVKTLNTNMLYFYLPASDEPISATADECTYLGSLTGETEKSGTFYLHEEHVYDDDCDEDCNECKTIRTDAHTYDNDCDADCNECGDVRELDAHSYTNGICVNGCYEVAKLVEGIYQIGNAGQLMWFMEYVNAGNFDADAILINNINMNAVEWTAIGTETAYTGTFDGDGYAINNLWQNTSAGSGARNGLFIYVGEGGVIKDLTVSNASVWASSAYSSNGTGIIAVQNAGTISGCMITDSGAQQGGYEYLGGIAGRNSATGVIENCAVINTAFTRRWGGSSSGTMGAIAQTNNGVVRNCYSYGCSFNNGRADKGAVVAMGNAPENSYYYTTSTVATTFATAKTQDEFASGKVTYLLNGDQTNIVWYQTIGEDDYPVFEGDTVSGVMIDGDAFITEDYVVLGTDNGDGTYSLPENVVGYYIDDEFVDAGKYEVEGNEIITTVNFNVTMVNGAQVRYSGGLDEEGKVSAGNGLRFLALVDRSNFDGEGYGMKLTAEGSDEETVVDAEKWQDDTTFSVALTDMAVSNYNRNFTATPFVKVKYADGAEKTIYGTQTVTRSIYYVAAGLLKTGNNGTGLEDGYGAGESYGLYDVLNAYVNMVGVRLNLYSDGTVTASDKYTGDVFFDVASVTNEDGSYTITVTPVTDGFSYPVEIMSYWNEFIRINNNNSVVKNYITDSKVEDGVLTFTFTVPSN